VPSDVERILQWREAQPDLESLGQVERREVAVGWFKKQFVASPGALVKSLTTGQMQRIGSITPRYAKGRCVFLDENERCTIHPVSPFGCSHYDVHMPWTVAHTRSLWATKQQCSAEYQALRNTLPYTQHYKPNTY
jgi:Fe-S-cluster containining protein